MQTALRSPIPDASLAVFPVNGENSHQGFEGRNPAPHPVREACKFTVLLGLRGQAELNRIGSRCTGKERDAETGLDYFGARHFSSSMGRMMSPDWSDIPDPVPFAELKDPQTLNLYSYAGNNPLRFKDIDGHKLVCTNTSTQDPNGNIHVTETCHEEPDSPLMLAGAAVLANEELGPAAWIVGGGLLATAACIQTHCIDAFAHFFANKTTTTTTVTPATTATPQPPNEPDPKNLTKNVRKIAQKLGKSVREVKDAIHEVKTNMPRGGPVRNPDVLVDTETGEVYPQTPGGHGDSIGNINDHLQ